MTSSNTPKTLHSAVINDKDMQELLHLRGCKLGVFHRSCSSELQMYKLFILSWHPTLCPPINQKVHSWSLGAEPSLEVFLRRRLLTRLSKRQTKTSRDSVRSAESPFPRGCSCLFLKRNLEIIFLSLPHSRSNVASPCQIVTVCAAQGGLPPLLLLLLLL